MTIDTNQIKKDISTTAGYYKDKITKSNKDEDFAKIVDNAKTASQIYSYIDGLEPEEMQKVVAYIRTKRPDLYNQLNNLLRQSPDRTAQLVSNLAMRGMYLPQQLGIVKYLLSKPGKGIGDILQLIMYGSMIKSAVNPLVQPLIESLSLTEGAKRKLARKYYQQKDLRKFQRYLDQADEIAYRKLERASSPEEKKSIQNRIGKFSELRVTMVANMISMNFSEFIKKEGIIYGWDI